jgi:hypothetical protein
MVLKVPDSCRDLDLASVSRVLTRHRGDLTTAARELGVSAPDLRRLTWAKPHLLDDAHEEMELVVLRAQGELIQALFSGDERRQMWAADRILSSWMARDSPLAPGRRSETRATIVTRFEEMPGETAIARDEKIIPVPRYDKGRGLEGEAAAQPPLPAWPGPVAPPPLIARLYAPRG